LDATAAVLFTLAPSTLLSNSATAAALPTADELRRLQVGHARIQYLLVHWNDLTQVCGTATMSDVERKQVIRTEGGGGTGSDTGCQKTPLAVQEYMGYKSTTDPLFKADKLLAKASALVLANNPDNYDNYVAAVDQYQETADQTALLAYTSSWGEANP
jgi:hypothetical protein